MGGVSACQADQVLVLVNPKAGRRAASREIERFCEILPAKRFHTTVLSELAQAADRANQWHSEHRLKVLVGVGGDGTAAELVNRTIPGVPITLLAAGTANLLAKHFRLAKNAEQLARVVCDGYARQVDAGLASGRVFLLMVGCGLDADIVARVHQLRSGRDGHITYWTYLKPILQSLRSYQYPKFRVYCDPPEDGSTEEQGTVIEARWLVVSNLPRYGWGVRFTPTADPTDGLLDLCGFAHGSLWRELRFVAAAQLGLHGRMADCASYRVRRLRIEADQPVPYQLDGDPGGVLPLDVEVLPHRLTLIVPPEHEPPNTAGAP